MGIPINSRVLLYVGANSNLEEKFNSLLHSYAANYKCIVLDTISDSNGCLGYSTDDIDYILSVEDVKFPLSVPVIKVNVDG